MATLVGHKKLAANLGLDEGDVVRFVKRMKKTAIGYVASGSGHGFVCDQDKFVAELSSLSGSAKASYTKRKEAGKANAAKRHNKTTATVAKAKAK